MFVKFENNKGVHIVGILGPDENVADWTLVDDSLMDARRIIKDGDTIRAATEEEVAAELAELLVSSTARSLTWKRDEALRASDNLVLADRWASFTDAQKAEVTAYRKALRDLPTLTGFPLAVTLPTAPVL